MKIVIFAVALLATFSVFAQSNCFSIQDEIDRKYCLDKYLQAVKTKLAAEKKSWGVAITGDVKESRSEALAMEIQNKKDQQALALAEQGLLENHLKDLEAVKASAPAKPKKKKKKEKKKNPFGIKL